MNKSHFELQCLDNSKFICNRTTGKWAVADSPEFVNQEYLDTKVCTPFLGTQMIVLNMTKSCNLDCVYCFAREDKGENDMSIDVVRKSIDRIMELPVESRKVVFHGREPLMNYNGIMCALDYGKILGPIDFCVQTNGTLLTDDRIRYLTNEGVGIGISIDGLEVHHNKTRPYLRGKHSYQKVTQAINDIIKIRGGVSVVTVVTKHNVQDLEKIIDEFDSMGINEVNFNPAYPNTIQDYAPDQEVLVNSMKRVFDNQIDRIIKDKPGIKISNLKDIFRSFFSPRATHNCAKCGGTPLHPIIGIDTDGTICPCDMFWGREEYSLGNIMETSILSALNDSRNFRVSRPLVSECQQCDWQMYCGGECPGSALRCLGNISSKGHYCHYRKEMLNFAAEKISFLHEKRILGKILEI